MGIAFSFRNQKELDVAVPGLFIYETGELSTITVFERSSS